MTDYCEMCHRPCEDGQDFYDDFHHQVCQDEWVRRFRDGKCCYCGVNDAGHNNVSQTPWCDECAAGGGAIELRGYPGP